MWSILSADALVQGRCCGLFPIQQQELLNIELHLLADIKCNKKSPAVFSSLLAVVQEQGSIKFRTDLE
jgi:hypothetical protein